MICISDSEIYNNNKSSGKIKKKIKQKQLSLKSSSKIKSFLSSNTTILLLKKTHDWEFLVIFEAF